MLSYSWSNASEQNNVFMISTSLACGFTNFARSLLRVSQELQYTTATTVHLKLAYIYSWTIYKMVQCINSAKSALRGY
jgi:hypothetical protein